MSGNKYVLDTNAIVALLQGNKFILKELENAASIVISVISFIEFLSFPSLSLKDKSTFKQFVEKVEMIGIPNDDLFYLESIAEYKILSGLKIPDIIIAAAALSTDSVLITNDKDFHKMKGLKLFTFQLSNL
jgi:hypothetical protein